MLDNLPLSFDWFILALRLLFILLVYIFLYQIARVTIRELVAIGTAAPGTSSPVLPNPTSALEVIDPAESSLETGSRLPLDHYSTVGRAADNSIVIDDGFVSGHHAEVSFDQGGWWLMDLGSTNGTRLNDVPVNARAPLQTGDIVQFGRVALRAMI